MVTFYKVEWEGYGLEDATWKSVDELLEEDLGWMIEEYEAALQAPTDDTELAIMSIFTSDSFAVSKPPRSTQPRIS